jgi:uncharacterized protein
MNALIGSASFALVCYMLFLAGKSFDRRLSFGAGLVFMAYLGLDDVLTGLPSMLPAANLLPGAWNWDGKLYSLLLGGLLLLALRPDPHAIGLTFAVKRPRSTWIAVGLLVMLSSILGLVFRPDAPDIETLLFQPLMPGLAEELAYRGIAPALLLSAMRGRISEDGIPWAVVFITGFAFGAWHGLSYSNEGLSFDPMSALFPLIGGLAYGWLRFHSGSIWPTCLAHGLGNLMFLLVPRLLGG